MESVLEKYEHLYQYEEIDGRRSPFFHYHSMRGGEFIRMLEIELSEKIASINVCAIRLNEVLASLDENEEWI